MKIIDLHQEEKNRIQLAADNNRQAQQLIYTTYASKMLSVCRLYIKDIHHAEDVMITAFMKVFIGLSNFEHKGSFEGWIRRIMINESISYIRFQKKISFLDDEQYIEQPTNSIEIQFNVEEIQFLIDALPDGYKMVFNLYVIEGYKHNEIAELLSISTGTSKSQLSQARRILQREINKLNTPQNGTR
ncbi:MAG: sigma-70 family RNA polymerase sigma factor [Flavobacterium sp.]|nr:sigma-70 family RNA polymerase sigma factor [Flavobacterium sp.]